MHAAGSRYLALFLGALLLAPAYAHRETYAHSKEECQAHYQEWLKLKQERDGIQEQLDQIAAGTYESDLDIITAGLEEALAALEEAGGNLEEIKDKLGELKKLVDGQIEALDEFIKGVEDGTDVIGEKLEEAKAALEKLQKLADVIAADPKDPEEALKAFSAYLEFFTEVFGPLIEKIPGLREMWQFYLGAVLAIKDRLLEIRAKLREKEVAILGYDPREPLEREKSGIQNKMDELWNHIKQYCGRFYSVRSGDIITKEQQRILDQQAAAAAAQREWERQQAEEEKRRKQECRQLVRKLEGLKNRAAQLRDEIKKIAAGASPNQPSGDNLQPAEDASAKADELKKVVDEAKATHREIKRKCGDPAGAGDGGGGGDGSGGGDPDDFGGEADDLWDEIEETGGEGRWAAAGAVASFGIAEEKEKLKECLDECRRCLEELEELKDELEDLEGELEDTRQEIEDEKQALTEAEKKVADFEKKSTLHIWETASGHVFTSMSASQPDATYKGSMVPPKQSKKLADARRDLQDIRDGIAELEAEAERLEEAIEEKKEEIAAKEEECRRCREDCARRIAEFEQRTVTWRRTLKDDGSVQEARDALEGEARELEGEIDAVVARVDATVARRAVPVEGPAPGEATATFDPNQVPFGTADDTAFLPDAAAPGRGLVAGDEVEWLFQVSPETRWDAVRRQLRNLVRAYVHQDTSGCMAAISDDFQLDASILRNALESDFQREDNINLDVELLSYQLGKESASVRIRWNRTAINRQTGIPTVNQGESTLLFDRRSGFGLSNWQGPPALGVTDPAWLAQARGGALDFQEPRRDKGEAAAPTQGGGGGGATPPPAAPPPGPPPLMMINVILGPANQFAYIDLLGRNATPFNGPPPPPNPGDAFFIQLGGPTVYTLQQRPGGPGNVLSFCADNTTVPDLNLIRTVSPTHAANAQPVDGNRRNYFSVLVPAGPPALIQVDVTPAGGGAQNFQLSYFLGSPGDPEVNKTAAFPCP